jgi:hypothetical protein
MASTSYRENHYVARWYERRFLPVVGEKNFHYLDLKPEQFRDPNGVLRQKKALNRWGTDRCFKQTDLYTTRFGAWESTEIEQFFFGRLDTQGRDAVEYFATFAHPDANEPVFTHLLNYMSVQKLRTPKGLAQLATMTGMRDSNAVLLAMQQLQNLYCAIWTEAIWALIDATQTRTKFILSDHPVTVYNRECFPGSQWCRDFRDPDIRLVGTHTIFPLSPTRALVLTNHSWVRNPYGRATQLRPNPNFFRTAMFYFPGIQTGRELTEVEVNQINFIIKRRAYRCTAAADEPWLHPERHIPSEHWRKLDDLYLLMPDPRSVTVSEEIIIGYDNRRSEIFDAYGRRPGQPGFKDQNLAEQERRTHYAFQGEPARAGRERRALEAAATAKLHFKMPFGGGRGSRRRFGRNLPSCGTTTSAGLPRPVSRLRLGSSPFIGCGTDAIVTLPGDSEVTSQVDWLNSSDAYSVATRCSTSANSFMGRGIGFLHAMPMTTVPP